MKRNVFLCLFALCATFALNNVARADAFYSCSTPLLQFYISVPSGGAHSIQFYGYPAPNNLTSMNVTSWSDHDSTFRRDSMYVEIDLNLMNNASSGNAYFYDSQSRLSYLSGGASCNLLYNY